MQTKTDKTDQFLSLLFEPNDLIEIRPIETWTDSQGKKQSRTLNRAWLTREALAEKWDALKRLNLEDNANIFFGVNPRPAVNTGSKNDIRICRSLWTDIDDVTPQAFRDRLKELSLPSPSIVVHSGHGIHAYWILEEPIEIPEWKTEKDKDGKPKKIAPAVVVRIESAVCRLLDAIGGNEMRGTQDVSRILRLPHPDLKNVKNARNGGKPSAVNILHIDPTARFSLDSIEALLPSEEPATKPTPKPKTQAPKGIDAIIAELDKPTDDRSTRDYAVCCRLAERGLDKATAWGLVSSKSKFADRDWNYFSTTWDKASMSASPKTVKNEFVPPQDGTQNLTPPPIDILPSPLKDMVQGSVAAYGGDGSAPLVWGLATLSAGTSNLAVVHHVGKHWSPLNLPTSLYFSIIGESGSQKTQAGKSFLAPFAKAQAQHAAEFAAKRQEVQTALAALNAQIRGKLNQIAKATEKNESVDDLNRELAALEKQKRELLSSLTGGAWAIDDATPEKILMLMRRTHGRAAYLGSEARVIQNILGTSYGSGSSEHLVLKSYDGELIKRDRVGQSPDDPFSELVVNHPALTLLTTFTPTLWAKLLGDASFRSSGFLSRCLPVQIRPQAQNYYAPSMSPETTLQWDALIDSLASIPVLTDSEGNPTPCLLGMTDDAYEWHLKRCQSFADKWTKSTTSDEYSDDTREWKNRYNTTTLRLAGLMHFVRYRTDYAKHKIGKDDVELGWRLYQYFALQFAELFEREEDTDTTKLMTWAVTQAGPFAKSEVNRGVRFKGNRPKAESAKEALADALAKGWLEYDAAKKMYAVTREYRNHMDKLL